MVGLVNEVSDEISNEYLGYFNPTKSSTFFCDFCHKTALPIGRTLRKTSIHCTTMKILA